MADDNKQYLGDGLYANFDGHQLCLTAEDGIRVHETVFLEPEVMHSFIAYAKRMGVLKE